jgi:hypothetical protein
MTQEEHHGELVSGIAEQFKPILEKSEQAIYIYLDDTHKVCNKKFATLLGYKSASDWASTAAPLADVIKADQDKVVAAYENASEKLVASSLDITLKKVKTKEIIKTRMIMAPTAYQGHNFVIHFLSKL